MESGIIAMCRLGRGSYPRTWDGAGLEHLRLPIWFRQATEQSLGTFVSWVALLQLCVSPRHDITTTPTGTGHIDADLENSGSA
jgi:hypothetical protein